MRNEFLFFSLALISAHWQLQAEERMALKSMPNFKDLSHSERAFGAASTLEDEKTKSATQDKHSRSQVS
jgi:hypothetical protein